MEALRAAVAGRCAGGQPGWLNLPHFAVFRWLGHDWDGALYKAATLLVAASPCAIVISVPAAILSALSAAARGGVLFKGGAALETLAAVETFAFVARAKGKLRGKKPKLSDRQSRELRRMYDTSDYSISDLAEVFSVSRPTVYRTLQRHPAAT